MGNKIIYFDEVVSAYQITLTMISLVSITIAKQHRYSNFFKKSVDKILAAPTFYCNAFLQIG